MDPACSDPLDLCGARDALLALPGPYRRDEVHRIVSRLRVTRGDLTRYLHWSDEHYTRTRFYQGERFEILVLCWQEGQMSPIHDHARSICTMLVLEGPCETTNYRIGAADGMRRLVRGRRTPLPPGNLTTVYAGDIHQVGNPPGSGAGLVTIHFYLPPIPEMLVWDEGNPEPRIQQAVSLDPEPEPVRH